MLKRATTERNNMPHPLVKGCDESAITALREALVEGETSGISTPFDFEAFIEGNLRSQRLRKEGAIE